MNRRLAPMWIGLLLAATGPAHAEYFGNDQGGTDFPQGISSFADLVAAFNPAIAAGNPTAPHLNPDKALGAPDHTNIFAGGPCPNAQVCQSVTLGDGGSITLRFTDNLLTGSGTTAPDLWVFEVGADIEATFVEISADGVQWFAVGKVFGSTAGIDIDAYGHGPGSTFGWVRLRDDPLLDGQTGYSVGADIDAVGAISSVAVVPEPSTLALWLAGGGLVARIARRRHG